MLRLTGGEFRGRSIQTPGGVQTRPTQAKLRQAMFNSLQTVITDAVVLDLFAGSGALGFEALSRGAARVVFVESARPVVKLIQKNAASLGVADRTEIVGEPVEKSWQRLERLGPFDVVLADPPYAAGWEEKLLQGVAWDRLLTEGAQLWLEWSLEKSRVKALSERPPFLVKTREKNYGDTVLSTFRRGES